MSESTNPANAKSHRGDHGILWGFVWAAVITLIGFSIIGKSVKDNSRSLNSAAVINQQ